ncbi:glycosyltransferase [Catenovulum sp. SM1970]|uniref:PssE/Cps14G family polysaccharide biosynthesis glycosyltransferase n=1 Tax=Marinifaba aquimaris TaxID=2741323 RepID=UPI001572C7DE|nr:PssE/Cps14G family polysaccharide biosynthesis glycosyltransferase [Marinifaba aquimaris]NTS76893.1 glycosyltransferase [Marinifaba aquimaris]
MDVLVTVGTYQFDTLIKAVDEISSKFPDMKFTLQTGNGAYLPKHCQHFSFKPELDFNQFDLIITHAGAGNIYRLLEISKKIIVVPNLLRVDDHQKEIATFVQSNNLALACNDLTNLESVIRKVQSFQPRPYKKVSFFKSTEIEEYLQL